MEDSRTGLGAPAPQHTDASPAAPGFLDRANLTRAEAAERSRLISTHAYEVHVDVSGAPDPNSNTFSTRSTITFACAEPGAWTFLDFLGAEVESVVLNGRRLETQRVAGAARILLEDLVAENEVSVVATGLYSTSGEGLHRFTDPADGRVYLYTQYEPADARRVFANFEQPDLKARFTFHLTGPADWVLASNQPEAGRRSPPARPASGAVTVDFSPTPPLSTYITTLLAGPYHRVSERWEGHPASGAPAAELALYCRQALAGALDADRLFATTKAGLEHYHDLFGVPYPWGKYDQAFVPEYNLGAMENPGLVTFTEDYVFESPATEAQYEARATTIMHEMAHMWFGDLVTMRWWDDLWLKESFADFMGTLAVAEATEFTGAWTTFASRRKAWAYVQDQYPTTHPIVAEIDDLEAARQNFDGITYAKGASVLKQLAAYVGRQAFIGAARAYFARHAWSTAELADFLDVLAEASGRDMAAWSRAWLQTAGVPELWVEAAEPREPAGSGGLELHQTGLDPATGQAVLRPHALKVGVYGLDDDGQLVRRDSTAVDVPSGDEGAATAVGPGLGDVGGATSGHAVGAAADPESTVRSVRLLLPNDEDLTYAKIRLDPDSLHAVLAHPVNDRLARATVWAALWNMTRDGHLAAGVFIESVRRLSAAIPDVGVYGQVLAQAVTALERYAPADQRPGLRDELGIALMEALHSTGQGSGRQRVAARVLARLARGAGDRPARFLGPLQALANGGAPAEQVAPGLEADAEIRWAALQALSALGAVDRTRLNAELERELSARTRLWHRTAAAAVPDPQGRAAAWEAVMSGRTAEGEVLSNDHLSAVAEGFTASRPDLADPFTERFWPALEEIWGERSNGLATRTIEGLFPAAQDAVTGGPAAQDDHPVVVAAQQWLDGHPQAPSALRRIILEQTDDLLRSLRAQASTDRQTAPWPAGLSG